MNSPPARAGDGDRDGGESQGETAARSGLNRPSGVALSGHGGETIPETGEAPQQSGYFPRPDRVEYSAVGTGTALRADVSTSYRIGVMQRYRASPTYTKRRRMGR